MEIVKLTTALGITPSQGHCLGTASFPVQPLTGDEELDWTFPIMRRLVERRLNGAVKKN
jgi:hypothetical protein